MMIDIRSQSVIFSGEALPSLFHQNPLEFLYYLERDGNVFLRFYWDEVGKRVAAEDRIDSPGLDHVIYKPQKDVTIAIVSLPAPLEGGEAYMEAFIFRPGRITPILRINDTTTVYALTRSFEPNDGIETRIVEMTRRGDPIDQGAGPDPKIEEFYQVVIALITDSDGNL